MEQVLYTSYLIDGLDNNERFWRTKFAIPSGFVKDVTVLTISAEYGLTGSGIINIPRSGSNETTEKFSYYKTWTIY
jgi:hypothetical protein